ncbi:hypothetical protein [Neisseria sicca]|uniref:hypothetical protein n=1 Tax=Neisseria sicca TaxID=490 RepID=UPI000302BD73|nr:hypothetical protein [Neisseria sicca]QMT37518.1 hypothetical protein H3L95_10370 [Neisseria sicca]
MNKRGRLKKSGTSFFKTQISEFSDDLVFIFNLPPLPSGGRGLGRGWLYGLYEFDLT